MKICLFGGTFDPPHLGHQAIINQLLLKDYDLIIVMPTGDVNYKKIQTDKQHRLAMCKLWIESFNDQRLVVDDFEVNRCEVSTTVQTLKYLIDKYPNANLTMAIGYDSYQDLDNWDDIAFIRQHLNFEVYNRNGQHNYFGNNINLSSTELRKYFNPLCVNPVILPYIVENQLYDLQPFIVNYEQVSPHLDIELTIRKRVNYIKQQLLASGLKNLIIGISGGQDSTLCAKLADIAIKELGEGYHLYLVRLPYGQQLDESDCQDVINWLDIKLVITYNIKEVVDIVNLDIDNTSDFNKGNIKARMRMVYQYALAGKIGGLVLGTDHASENVTGFFTKFGDGASDLNPLFGLNKRQGKKLLEYFDCPTHLYLKQPTADLEDDQPQKSDEEALAISYDTIDDYLENKDIDINDKQKIELLFVKTLHKRYVSNYVDILY